MDIAPSSFTVRFLDQAVSISSTNPQLTKAIQTHFAHCGSAEINAHLPDFQIEKADDAWQLTHHKTIHCVTKNEHDILPHLMEHVLSELISPVASHLIIHAAGVRYKNNGIILCGASGAGKSTLAMQLLTRGYDYLSDELIALSPSADILFGLPRSLVLKHGATSLWQQSIDPNSDDVLTFPNGTSWLNPAIFKQSNIVNKAQPKLLLFPTYLSNSQFAITPITAGKASFNLLNQVPNARNLPHHGLRLVEKIAATVPAFEVTYANSEPLINWLADNFQDA